MANFNSVPTIHAPRARFDLSYSNKFSANVGTLYPFHLQEVYPGDNFDTDVSFVTRLTSAYIRPVMDDLYQDVYFFFVPSRLCFNKWEQIFGENRDSAWAQSTPVSAPTFQTTDASDLNIVSQGSVADYLGLPIDPGGATSILPNGVSVLPFRAFALVYDQWFRDENIVAPMEVQKGDYVYSAEHLNSGSWSSSNYTGMLPHVAKFHDYFTSCLPGTQKGDAVTLPITGFAPVVAQLTDHDAGNPIKLYRGNMATGDGAWTMGVGNVTADNSYGKLVYGTSLNAATLGDFNVNMTNLAADLSGATQATVNDLRYAFQLQKILERSARGGTRYIEYLLSAFGVRSPDARLQRTEYLGGKRMPLSTQQVAQTTRAESGAETLASLGAFSLSNGKAGFAKGFPEHGYVLGVYCIRQRHTYQQGIEKFWSRSSRFSFYDPAFANIGEQPVYKDEIYALSSSIRDINSTPFGYQEAWADLRYRPNRLAGQMRSDNTTSLDIWHFADDYANAPTLNKAWLEETPTYVDRTLAVPSTSLDQFIVDAYIRNIAVRRLPTYSVPSLIDHG